MEILQLREKEIFETLKKLKKFDFVIIGGYAVNLYALPRFSVDCDIVLKDNSQLKNLLKELEKFGYVKTIIDNANLPYHKDFIRCEKDINGLKVSLDILVKNVLDRTTKVNFDTKWIFENSHLDLLKGKTISKKLKLRIINIDALIVMKFISCRNTDIRDIFMLLSKAKDLIWIKKEIAKRYNFKNRFIRVKDTIISQEFRNNLQGVHGKIDDKTFESYKKVLLNMD